MADELMAENRRFSPEIRARKRLAEGAASKSRQEGALGKEARLRHKDLSNVQDGRYQGSSSAMRGVFAVGLHR